MSCKLNILCMQGMCTHRKEQYRHFKLFSILISIGLWDGTDRNLIATIASYQNQRPYLPLNSFNIWSCDVCFTYHWFKIGSFLMLPTHVSRRVWRWLKWSLADNMPMTSSTLALELALELALKSVNERG